HVDSILAPPPGFKALGRSTNAPIAAMADERRRLYALQFHPEVSHTEHGRLLLAAFLRTICGCGESWKLTSFIEEAVAAVRERVGSGRVIAGLSGGVDSA